MELYLCDGIKLDDAKVNSKLANSPLIYKEFDESDGGKTFHNMETCKCWKKMTQDQINNQIIGDLIDNIEVTRKELSLEGHDLRINHLENFIKFIQSEQFVDYMKEKLKEAK